MRARPLLAALALALAATLPPGAAAAAPPGAFPERIPLPPGFQPEGIDAGPGTTFYVGSLADGSIYRGDLRTGEGAVLAEGAGAPAVGVLHEAGRDRLWVAGGASGEVRAYDATTGELLALYSFPGAGFLNDVAIADGAVHVTDSVVPQLAVIPLGAGGALPDEDAATTLPLTGDLVYGAGFNANGIVATPEGALVLVQSGTGLLFAVDPATGVATTIDLGGATVVNGDGLELRGRTLFVVQNRLNQVAPVRLAADLRTGTVGPVLTDPDFRVPTTIAFAAGRLWAVNARFGTPPGPDVDYDVVQVALR
ncbi:superoxide dismutase [Cellulomonas endophytica]|uniref:superoxide dismutase n=1 Tax=Cellulomonas endophytica TaxID=2494735 RepID=UPI00101031E4|nr:superoxide dismutase [Cellulomonas endophytica]